ncbi:hypothetical protein ACQ4PT_008816 [Festuca glaucescens]
MSRSMVKASVMRPRVVLAVSNLDLLSQDIPVWLLCVYRRPSASSGDFNIEQAAIPLDHFYPLAGRIVADPRSGLPELHCDNQGADVIVGEVSEALGSLHYGDLAASLARIGIPVQFGADVALSVQLVSFACGGFAVAWGSNHLLLDGCALYMIANAWPELAGCSGTTISAAPPNHDRSVFRPRAPPAYSSSTGELFGLVDSKHLVNALTARTSFVGRIYYIEEQDLVKLRAQAGRRPKDNPPGGGVSIHVEGVHHRGGIIGREMPHGLVRERAEASDQHGTSGSDAQLRWQRRVVRGGRGKRGRDQAAATPGNRIDDA